ncbi:MAG: molybdopterin converting factor subunit 1 [Pseudomonadota bacterium]
MKLLYFAWLRERIGTAREEVEVPTTIVTAGDLVDWLKTREPRYAAAFEDVSAIKVAIDQKQADFSTPVQGAGEVAFFPPVTGG